MRSNGVITNALSFDIEDWFHMVEIEAVADPASWPGLPSIVESCTEWILSTLEHAEVRATFFVLGWIAERYPALVKSIADAGHELATHSFWHRKVYDLNAESFREDLERSITAIRDAAGPVEVRGFRAPSFSITPGSEWALDVLIDLGLTYDASFFPAPRGHGGYPSPQMPHTFTATPSGRPIRELPISVMRLGPTKLAFAGGGYLRLLPKPLIRRGFASFERRGWPVVVYLHPRDFCPEQPRVPMPLRRRFKSYVGLATTKGKLEMMLSRYRFDTCAAVLGLEDPALVGHEDPVA